MNLNEVRQLAKERGVVPGKLRKAELICRLQAQEGNAQCYNTNYSQDCGQQNCLWRADCK